MAKWSGKVSKRGKDCLETRSNQYGRNPNSTALNSTHKKDHQFMETATSLSQWVQASDTEYLAQAVLTISYVEAQRSHYVGTWTLTVYNQAPRFFFDCMPIPGVYAFLCHSSDKASMV